MNHDEPQCPTCRIDLAPTMYETAMIWACPICTGTFMPRDQLDAITANMTYPRSDAERLDALDRSSDRLPLLDVIRDVVRCPWCRRDMGRSVFDGRSGIAIDECDRCGVWLDPGELPRTEAWREAIRLGLRARKQSGT